jgi:hypothetical protein
LVPPPTPTPAPSIGLSPESSSRASRVAVAVQGFTPSGTATVKYAGTIVATSQADRNGAFDTLFTVPLSAALNSTHIVEAVDDVTGRTVSADHRVPPPILSLEPEEGFPGTPFIVVGEGFPPSADVKPIVFNGIDLSPFPNPTSDGLGAFVVQLLVPKMSGGDVTVSATAGGGVAAASFTVLPTTLGLTPSAGPPNTSVIVNGWNFPASSDLGSLSIGGVDVLANAESLRANLGLATTIWGQIELEVKVPEIPSGNAEVVAEVAGVSASSILAVPPIVLELTPRAGPIFGPVTIRGSGFPAFTLVMSASIKEVPVLGSHQLETDADGAFTLSAVVPAFSPGPVQVSVTVGTTSANTDFVVTP